MLTSDWIVGGAGVLIALIFGYFPVLREKFAGLSPEAKSGIMIGTLVVTAFGVWGAGCIGWIDSGVACTTASIPQILKLILIAIVSNQAANRISPELPDVKTAKIERNIPGQSGQVYNPERQP